MTEKPPPLLSIVTGTVAREDSFIRFLHSITLHTQVDYELIIMDASNEGYSLPRCLDHPFARPVIELPRLGHVAGYNHAFRLCRGEYVIWLNDDAEVLPGYDTRAIELLRSTPRIGLGCFYYRSSDCLYKGFHVNSVWGMIFANFGIIRRELGNELGWFDDDLYFYGGDNSITFKTLMAGYGVTTVPGPSIIHHAPQDAIRAENETNRPKDSERLWAKYSAHRMKMRGVYSQFKVGPLSI